jgi:hypothetical protein
VRRARRHAARCCQRHDGGGAVPGCAWWLVRWWYHGRLYQPLQVWCDADTQHPFLNRQQQQCDWTFNIMWSKVWCGCATTPATHLQFLLVPPGLRAVTAPPLHPTTAENSAPNTQDGALPVAAALHSGLCSALHKARHACSRVPAADQPGAVRGRVSCSSRPGHRPDRWAGRAVRRLRTVSRPPLHLIIQLTRCHAGKKAFIAGVADDQVGR